MIETDKYEGHLSDLKEVAKTLEQHRATYALLRDAPLLLAEVKRLQKEVDLLSIDVCESLELILDAHHPEVKDSVMSMFGDAIGDNWPYYGTPLPNKEMIE